MRVKIFKTLDEQIEILQEKGLVINDYDKTRMTLFRENYFFINGYRKLFQNESTQRNFINGTKFEELYGTFLFDRHIRNIMFKYILIIENNIKSITSYQLSKKYGYKEKDYLNIRNFNQDGLKARQVRDVISKMKRQIRINGRQHTATIHYINNYGYVPLWVLTKVLSFGIVSELYNILKNDDQQSISSFYNIDSNTFSIYLALLSNFRNLCAHEDILYDHRTQRSIPNCKYHTLLGIDQIENEYVYGKNDLFALLIIMKQMLTEKEFVDLVNETSYEIDILDGIVDTVPLDTILNKIGFPNNWKDISKI